MFVNSSAPPRIGGQLVAPVVAGAAQAPSVSWPPLAPAPAPKPPPQPPTTTTTSTTTTSVASRARVSTPTPAPGDRFAPPGNGNGPHQRNHHHTHNHNHHHHTHHHQSKLGVSGHGGAGAGPRTSSDSQMLRTATAALGMLNSEVRPSPEMLSFHEDLLDAATRAWNAGYHSSIPTFAVAVRPLILDVADLHRDKHGLHLDGAYVEKVTCAIQLKFLAADADSPKLPPLNLRSDALGHPDSQARVLTPGLNPPILAPLRSTHVEPGRESRPPSQPQLPQHQPQHPAQPPPQPQKPQFQAQSPSQTQDPASNSAPPKRRRPLPTASSLSIHAASSAAANTADDQSQSAARKRRRRRNDTVDPNGYRNAGGYGELTSSGYGYGYTGEVKCTEADCDWTAVTTSMRMGLRLNDHLLRSHGIENTPIRLRPSYIRRMPKSHAAMRVAIERPLYRTARDNLVRVADQLAKERPQWTCPESVELLRDEWAIEVHRGTSEDVNRMIGRDLREELVRLRVGEHLRAAVKAVEAENARVGISKPGVYEAWYAEHFRPWQAANEEDVEAAKKAEEEERKGRAAEEEERKGGRGAEVECKEEDEEDDEDEEDANEPEIKRQPDDDNEG
ncbi:uncharacterized protein PgNI_02122 [Pyricularia grisea]|uniref:Uncharacterized protein n=1 Tax=Pyricularia grisea TaxID=148305 RepID=A0A6P8BLU5_PYRGI|nr:uncharacterized protein PgNI_02122 [Pyricularia grisea]TLD17788.1 hypothetical protein PgNI_02122 [Pyricularia grisea]